MLSNNLPLNWVALSLSVFNAILLFWLGLTVLLNSERRSWGIWTAGSGLILGAALFNTHTIILVRGFGYAQWRPTWWWLMGFLPTVLLPYAWYAIMLWYAGYWNTADSPLRHRQRPWFILLSITMAILTAVVLTGAILTTPTEARRFLYTLFPQLIPILNMRLATLLLLGLGSGYCAYTITCIIMAIHAIYRPGPTARMMGDVARQRARPWLFSASVTLLVVGTLLATTFGWFWYSAQQGGLTRNHFLTVIGHMDVVLLGLISAAIVCTGQAAVAYEVFTGQVLPRRGLRQQWYLTLASGLGFSLLISGTTLFNLPSLSNMLLMSMLVTGFAATVSWRSFQTRQETINSLRPFVTSQHLYEQLLTPQSNPELNLQHSLAALCRNMLGTNVAHLIPIGRVAPLSTTPLSYPSHLPLPAITDLLPLFPTPTAVSQPLHLTTDHGLMWAIPLWHERGLIGLFLLGPKQNQSPYTQEEIEIARASGERLLDIQATTEMARLLVSLQRQQMVQSQLLDQNTRRVIHDDVLPQLHTAMLAISGDADNSQTEVIASLTAAHQRLANLLREMPHATHPILTRLGVLAALKELMAQEMASAFDAIQWQIDPSAVEQAPHLPPFAAEILFYAAREAIRNAAKHGRTPQHPLHLKIQATYTTGLELVIEDNGRGLSTPSAAPSTGQGLALHSTMLAIIGGQLTAASLPHQYTRITLFLPTPSAA